MQEMRRSSALLALIACWALSLPAVADEPVVLTIHDGISTTNRGPVDGFRDVFFKFNDIAFDAAYELGLATLAELPQATVTANAESFPAPITASGARLDAVLALVGAAPDATITIQALDGYSAEITAEMRQKTTWVLASEVDGAPIGLGGRGPLWLLPETNGATAPSDESSRWVWAAFLIRVHP